jgi:competence ComEA-like helix-hairpin-helix protein
MKTGIFRSIIWVFTFVSLLAAQPGSWAAQQAKSADNNGTTEPRANRPTSKKVDLNTASKEDLQALPGVGPVTADAIIAARPFKSVQDLKNVRGIGETKFGQLRSQVTVSHAKGPHATTAAPKGASGSNAASERSSSSGASDANTKTRATTGGNSDNQPGVDNSGASPGSKNAGSPRAGRAGQIASMRRPNRESGPPRKPAVKHFVLIMALRAPEQPPALKRKSTSIQRVSRSLRVCWASAQLKLKPLSIIGPTKTSKKSWK